MAANQVNKRWQADKRQGITKRAGEEEVEKQELL